jgi:pimeloyl-ACP methyl ester carboxylesterase
VLDAGFVRELSEGMVGREVPEVVMATLCEENLKVPARVWGARDPLLRRSDQEAMAAEIPGARLVIYADVGHLPVIEAPERVAADLTGLCDAVAAR